MKTIVGFLAFAALTLPLLALRARAQDITQEQAAQFAQNLIRQHEAWRSKLSTPGASIQAKESGRENGYVHYRLYVTGLPADKLYTVLAWPVTQAKPSQQFEGVSLGKDGLVSCTGRLPDECSDPDPSPMDHGAVDFAFHPVKGEPFRLAVVNGDSRATIIVVPDPIASKDKGCSLEVVRLMPAFELAFFTGRGYPPNAEVTFDAESYGEKHEVKTKSDSDGAIHFAIMPAVAGHSGGTARIAATEMVCAPKLKFDWGKQ
jgi:hypothetical protein